MLHVTSGYAGGSEADPTHEQVWGCHFSGFSNALLELFYDLGVLLFPLQT